MYNYIRNRNTVLHLLTGSSFQPGEMDFRPVVLNTESSGTIERRLKSVSGM